MESIYLFIYIMVCYGIANTIIYAHGPFHIFDAMHNIARKIHPQLEELLSCFICSGWWLGFIMSAINLIWLQDISFTPMNMLHLPTDYWPLIVFFDGAFVSATNWLINVIEERIENNDSNN